MSICNDAKLDNKLLSRPVSPLGGEDSTNSSEKSTISQEQMSESGISNYEDPKSEQVQDGRWTREEHYRFLKAVAIYGREWKLVQTAIKTRTSAQIRSHAQKHFQKCAKEEQSNQAPGVSDDAFVVLELCERVLKTLKRKRDDYNLANNVPADDSDHDGSTENDAESSNNSLSSSSSSLNTSNHSVYSFAYPVGEESTVLGRDELIALEFLCCNKKDNYCPLETKSDGYSASFSELMYTPASPSKAQADERKKQEYKSPISPMLQNFQLKESFSSCGKYTEQNKNKEDLDTTRRNSDHP